MHYPIVDGLIGNVNGYVYALNNVDLEIYENEILGLVGESGSGKSTLGNCVLKLIEPTSGEVIFNNENILNKKKKDLKDFRKKAQLIFQNPYTSLDIPSINSSLISSGYIYKIRIQWNPSISFNSLSKSNKAYLL